jgi:hypothetical protein
MGGCAALLRKIFAAQDFHPDQTFAPFRHSRVSGVGKSVSETSPVPAKSRLSETLAKPNDSRPLTFRYEWARLTGKVSPC